jgi:hypothetical protein
VLGGDRCWQRAGQALPPGGGWPQRHPRCETDQVVTVAGLSQGEPRLAAPDPELPGERRTVISLTVNLAVKGP